MLRNLDAMLRSENTSENNDFLLVSHGVLGNSNQKTADRATSFKKEPISGELHLIAGRTDIYVGNGFPESKTSL
jgi:hypothetical protein